MRARLVGQLLVLVAALLAFAPAANADPTVRATLTWDQQVDIDLHIYDTEGHHAWYSALDAIPGAQLTRDNIAGFPSDPVPEVFQEDVDPGRELAFRLCYFSGGGGVDADGNPIPEPVTHSTLVVNHPDGSTTTHEVTLEHVDDCKDVTLSPVGRHVNPVAQAHAGAHGRAMTDPFTGELDIWMPSSNRSALTVNRKFDCPSPSQTPTNVQFSLRSGGVLLVTHDAERIDQGSGSEYQATFLEGELQTGVEIVVTGDCGGVPSEFAVGQLSLIDPSGRITDALTGQPVADATVTLYRVPAWTPRVTSADDATPNTCESPESRAVGAAWTQVVPAGGIQAEPLDPSHVIDPGANPVITNDDGGYAWNVQAGSCWYIVVSKAGYEPKTSTLVGVFSLPVLDLDLQLTPIPVVTGGGGDDTRTPVTPAPPLTNTQKPKRQVTTRLFFKVMGTMRKGIRFGGRLTPTTKALTCGAKATIIIQKRTSAAGKSDGDWIAATRATTDAQGRFKVAVRGRGVFRAMYLGSAKGNMICLRSTSPTRKR